MKNMIITIAVLSGMLVAGSYAMEEHPGEHKGHGETGKHEKGSQTTCPVSGDKIDKSLYVDHNGKRIYTCCKGCIKKVKADPEKYIKKLEDKGVTLRKIQTTCPVMGGKIDKEFHADHDGKRVYFSAAMCSKKFKKDPAKYIKKLEDEGVTLDKVQTKCPVMGGKIDKKLFADHSGKRVYFCCPKCQEKFDKNPAKYIKKLEDKGITLQQPGKIVGSEKEHGEQKHEKHNHH